MSLVAFLNWFKTNWLGVIQTLGVLAAAYGLYLTYCQLIAANGQLGAANAQLEQAKQTLRANTIFAIQKDGRELIGNLMENPKLFRFMFDMDKGPVTDPELRFKAEVRFGQLINFYASIYNQYQAGAIDEKFWKTSFSELCSVLQTPFGASKWRGLKPEGYQSGFSGGRVCLDRNRRWISEASAGWLRRGLVAMQGGRSPTGVATRPRRRTIHAASARGMAGSK